MAEDSPLLPGASHHNISHPEELTLVFKSKFPGSHCCILPADAEEEDGNIARNQSMVEEGRQSSYHTVDDNSYNPAQAGLGK